VGDLARAGAPLRARFRGSRSGHALNNRLLRALFADASAWRFAGLAAFSEGVSATPMRAAAAPAIA
jgi:UDP-3-O-[3-hydroxymyristoyl] N-acetylglucosamine deacetylase